MKLHVLVDDSLLSLVPGCTLAPASNKHVLSLLNDFEEGAWRYDAFQSLIWDNVAETALSHRERQSLVGRSHSELAAAAKNLRLTDRPDDVGEGSELAEILLYAVMKHRFGALPVVPKIFYKQNAQDFAKGADSVHIVVKGNDFTLWFGEAKFYSTLGSGRLDKVVASVFSTLQKGKIKKEAAIITNVSDLDLVDIADELRARIKMALNPDISLDDIKPKLHVPILLLHECQLTSACVEVSSSYREDMLKQHTELATAYFTKQVEKAGSIHMYGAITFHVILVPVPNKKHVVDRFLKSVAYHKGQ